MIGSLNSLLSDIENKRTELITLAFQLGYANPNVVQCSQKLDDLLNTFHKEK